MPGNKPNLTQERRILEVLQDAAGAWVNGQHFLRELYLSQYHRAIWNLQHHRERYGYGGEIEASDFTDAHGFKSYRLVANVYIFKNDGVHRIKLDPKSGQGTLITVPAKRVERPEEW